MGYVVLGFFLYGLSFLVKTWVIYVWLFDSINVVMGYLFLF